MNYRDKHSRGHQRNHPFSLLGKKLKQIVPPSISKFLKNIKLFRRHTTSSTTNIHKTQKHSHSQIISPTGTSTSLPRRSAETSTAINQLNKLKQDALDTTKSASERLHNLKKLIKRSEIQASPTKSISTPKLSTLEKLNILEQLMSDPQTEIQNFAADNMPYLLKECVVSERPAIIAALLKYPSTKVDGKRAFRENNYSICKQFTKDELKSSGIDQEELDQFTKEISNLQTKCLNALTKSDKLEILAKLVSYKDEGVQKFVFDQLQSQLPLSHEYNDETVKAMDKFLSAYLGLYQDKISTKDPNSVFAQLLDNEPVFKLLFKNVTSISNRNPKDRLLKILISNSNKAREYLLDEVKQDFLKTPPLSEDLISNNSIALQALRDATPFENIESKRKEISFLHLRLNLPCNLFPDYGHGLAVQQLNANIFKHLLDLCKTSVMEGYPESQKLFIQLCQHAAKNKNYGLSYINYTLELLVQDIELYQDHNLQISFTQELEKELVKIAMQESKKNGTDLNQLYVLCHHILKLEKERNKNITYNDHPEIWSLLLKTNAIIDANEFQNVDIKKQRFEENQYIIQKVLREPQDSTLHVTDILRLLQNQAVLLEKVGPNEVNSPKAQRWAKAQLYREGRNLLRLAKSSDSTLTPQQRYNYATKAATIFKTLAQEGSSANLKYLKKAEDLLPPPSLNVG